MYSWVTANYAGHAKKAKINAAILIAYGASNVIGPLTFTDQTAPEYISAKAAIMATLVLRQIYVWENKKQDRETTVSGATHLEDIEFMDLTDKQNHEFRYAL